MFPELLPNIKTFKNVIINTRVLAAGLAIVLTACNNSSTPTDAFGNPITVKDKKSKIVNTPTLIAPTTGEPTVNEQIGQGLREGLNAAEKTGKPAVPAAKVAKEIILNPQPYIGSNRLDNPDAFDKLQKSAGDVYNGGINELINGNKNNQPTTNAKPIPYASYPGTKFPPIAPPAGSEWVRNQGDGGVLIDGYTNRELPRK